MSLRLRGSVRLRLRGSLSLRLKDSVKWKQIAKRKLKLFAREKPRLLVREILRLKDSVKLNAREPNRKSKLVSRLSRNSPTRRLNKKELLARRPSKIGLPSSVRWLRRRQLKIAIVSSKKL